MSIELASLAPRLTGYNIIDCEVQDRGRMFLLAREDYTQRPTWNEMQEPPGEGRLPKRCVSFRPNDVEGRKYGHVHLTGMMRSICSMAFDPEKKPIVIGIESRVWTPNPDTNGFEPRMDGVVDGGLLAGAVMRARTFGGSLLVATNARQLFVRMAPSQWVLLGPATPVAPEEYYKCGFEDFSQFTDDDLYAVGGSGDIWHFNGEHWRQCKFPTDWGLSAVCCAPDGEVYVADSVVIYCGRGDRWKRLRTKGRISLPIKDLVWFEDKIWATNDYGFWVLEGDTLVEADVPSDVKVCSGNLAVRDGVMLLAGYGGATYKCDGVWTTIFHDFELRQLAGKA